MTARVPSPYRIWGLPLAALRASRAAFAALLFLGCEAERPSTGIVHTPGERERYLAEVEAEAARRRDLEADAADQAAIERRRAERAEAELRAKLERAAAERRAVEERNVRCASQKSQRDAALAGLDAEVAAVGERFKRRQKAEAWIKAHCRVYGEKETSAELWTDATGKVRRREVVTGIRDEFQACPAKTPQDVIDDGSLSYDDVRGWSRFSVPPMPPKAEEHRAARLEAIGKIVSPDCPIDPTAP